MIDSIYQFFYELAFIKKFINQIKNEQMKINYGIIYQMSFHTEIVGKYQIKIFHHLSNNPY
jgi:hypothetical protein